MSYIDNNLMASETVVYRCKIHWAIFIWPVIWFVIAVLIFGSGATYVPFGIIFLMIAIVTFFISLINYTTSEFGITNKRVVLKIGFIRRKSIELLINKIESIQVDQGVLGRIFGYGSIIVSGTGGTKDPFHKIKSPLVFRKKAQEQIAAAQGMN